MIARYSGAVLGLLAFTIVIGAGVFVPQPMTVVLSRSLIALFGFYLIGLALGWAAQRVVNEHRENAAAEIERRARSDPKPEGGGVSHA